MPDDTRDIDCRGAVSQLWDFLDGELNDARMAEVRRHLEVCKRCLPHEQFGRRFLDALHSSRRQQLMPDDVREHVLAVLAKAGLKQP